MSTRRSIGACLVVAALAFAAAPAQAQVKFHGCGGPEPDVEPTEVVLTCADAKLRVEELKWLRWESSEALAAGTLTYPDCAPRVPLYRCRHYAHQPVKLRLFGATYCRRYGARVFTQANVIDESAPTPATRNSIYAFRCPRAQQRPRFFLGSRLARRLMRTALSRDSRLGFSAGYSRRVRCNKRVSRIRLRCKISWIVGDLSMHGSGMIWITFQGGEPHWNYAYRVVRFNEYCAATGGSDCSDVIRVR
jgi:hypothetical protein